MKRSALKTKTADKYKCKNRCGNKAEYYAGTTPVCSSDCAYSYLMKKAAAKKKKDDIAYRADTRKMAVDIRTRTKWYKMLEAVVNAHVLLIDHGKMCFTCDSAHAGSTFQAGHFLTVGHSKPTRFNLYNIHKQCARCNQFGGGMPKIYKVNLRARYGQDVVDSLEGPQASLKDQYPTTQDIESEIKVYQSKNLELNKWLGLK